MNVVENQGKTLNEALEKVLIELNANQSEVVYKSEEIEGKLFKSSSFLVSAVTKRELLNDMKKYLQTLVEGLGLKLEMETRLQDDTFYINMYSDNNPILIGKNGQTLKALETLMKQKYLKDWNTFFKISLDVEDYKTKRVEYLEKLAIRIAKEVRDTKIDVALDNMNSYERRIVHNKLTDFKGIKTTSEGEEPNRHIVIKAE
ncbi:MAG: KH domain-containing protein [Bacilli bacterium]|nr:KH domain-containing protein [Bacilli bacterium]